ncbi:MAG: hypothetical protein ACKOJF_27695 [Planctomycetaceae bacterium]
MSGEGPPPSTVLSFCALWGALLHGGRLALLPAGAAPASQRLLEFARASQVTVLVQTPEELETLRRAGQANLSTADSPSLRSLVVSPPLPGPSSPGRRSDPSAPDDFFTLQGILEFATPNPLEQPADSADLLEPDARTRLLDWSR